MAPARAAWRDRRVDEDLDRLAARQPGVGAQHRARADDRDRNDGPAALRGSDEGTHVKGAHAGLAREGPLGIDDERLAGACRVGQLARPFDCLARVEALDETRAGAPEQPAKQRRGGELALGGKMRTWRQERAEDQAVDVARVVGDEDGRLERRLAVRAQLENG